MLVVPDLSMTFIETLSLKQSVISDFYVFLWSVLLQSLIRRVISAHDFYIIVSLSHIMCLEALVGVCSWMRPSPGAMTVCLAGNLFWRHVL